MTHDARSAVQSPSQYALEADVSKRIREMADTGMTWKTNSFEDVTSFYRRLRAQIREEIVREQVR